MNSTIFDVIEEASGKTFGGTIHDIAKEAAKTSKLAQRGRLYVYGFIVQNVYFEGGFGGRMFTEVKDKHLPFAKVARFVVSITQRRIIEDAIAQKHNMKDPYIA